MTYTFKLARRLAISHDLFMLPVLLVLVACSGGDATAPEISGSASGSEGTNRELTPVMVSVTPSTVTVETNQLIHFTARALNETGDSVGAGILWRTSGGTILPDGRFS